MTTVDVRAVKLFFDRATVESALDKHERRVLGRTGAFTRKVMRNSIRKRPKKKGFKSTPPFPRYVAHSNSGLRLIFFVYEPAKGSVVIGPVKFRHKTEYVMHNRIERYDIGADTVPELLNTGGTSRVTRVYRSGRTYLHTFNYRKFNFVDIAREEGIERMQEIIAEEQLIG